MNGRQAAKLAAQRLAEVEHYNQLCIADIVDYNEVILAMIRHRSPCEWCEDLDECKGEGKNVDTGCDMWMLRGRSRVDREGCSNVRQDQIADIMNATDRAIREFGCTTVGYDNTGAFLNILIDADLQVMKGKDGD